MWRRYLAILAVVSALTALPGARASGGTVVRVVVHSPALEGNLLGDSADRPVSIYLPPGYRRHPAKRYPVLYLLHGYGATDAMWFGGGYTRNVHLPAIADRLILGGSIQPMIIVMPDADTRYGGSFYVDSSVGGNWGTFITHGLVRYVDAHYRTLARPGSRAIAGHSMGGYGALVLAMTHADTFRVVYAMSAPYLDLRHPRSIAALSAQDFLPTLKRLASGHVLPKDEGDVDLATAAAFSPDPGNPPSYVDLPYRLVSGKAVSVPRVWRRWQAHTPLAMLPKDAADLRAFRGVALDVGAHDSRPDFVSGARAFDAALTRAGVPHAFQVYDGNHTDRVAARLASVVLPFISRHLAGEAAATASR